MKKEERLHRLFGDIDDDLVADAARRPISLKVWLPRVTAVAAAVALVVGLTLAKPWAADTLPVSDSTATTTTQSNSGEADTTTHPDSGDADTTTIKNSTQQTEIGLVPPVSTAPDEPMDTTTVKLPYTTIVGTPSTTVNGGEVWYEPQWDDKPIWQQFREFERSKKRTYTVRDITIDKAMVEEYLQDVRLYGYDIYTETAYDAVGKVYRIKGINPDCAVALQYPNRSDFFPATCSKYYPATLGDLISDLSLREHLRVGTVYHSYRDADGIFHDKEYAGLTVEKVWEMLLSDNALSNEYNETDWQRQWNTKISIRIDMPLLGYYNISISLSEEGYLRTNLLDTEKLFHIGKDKVDAFMAYVEEHCRLQKDDELIPMPDDTDAVGGTTRTSPARPPLVTGTTVYKPAH